MYNENKEQRPGNKEPGNKESKEQGQRRPTGPIVIFRYQNNVKQKKMSKGKKIDLVDDAYNQKKFKEQSIENQRFDLLELTSALIDTSMNIISNCELLENKIEDVTNPNLLLNDLNFTDDFNSLGYRVTNLLKKYARFNSFVGIYLTNKNDEQ